MSNPGQNSEVTTVMIRRKEVRKLICTRTSKQTVTIIVVCIYKSYKQEQEEGTSYREKKGHGCILLDVL